MLSKNLYDIVFNNKKVLVTGHTGFKGSWLSLWLLSMGADVIGYSLNPPTIPNLYNLLNLNEKMTSIIGDVRDEDSLSEVVQKHKPEIIFHMAAQAIVLESYKNPKMTYETNIMGTINLFEAVRKASIPCVIVNITSDKCYANVEKSYQYKEDDRMGGYDPYSSSKGAAELITEAYRNSFFNPAEYGKTHNVSLASARAGNVIGGGDWAENRLVPDSIRSLINKELIQVRNPHSIRPWQHVLEPISGYLALASKLFLNPIKYCEGWNFGPEIESAVPVEDVVQRLIKTWGSGNYEVPSVYQKQHEAKLLMLDAAKAKTHLSWKPCYNLEQTIEKTALWYKNYYSSSKTDIYEFTLNQIQEYAAKVSEQGLTRI